MRKRITCLTFIAGVVCLSFFICNGIFAQEISGDQKTGGADKMPEQGFSEGASKINVANKMAIEELVNGRNIDEEKETSDLPEKVLVGETEVSFKYEADKYGVYQVTATVEEMGLEVTLDNEGISVAAETDEGQTRGMVDAKLDERGEIIPAGEKEPIKLLLDPVMIRKFISKMTDEETLNRLEEEIDGLKKSGEKEKDVLEELNECYSRFEIKFNVENLSGNFSENENLGQSSTRVEKLIGLIKQGETDISPENQEEILAGYTALREEVAPVIEQYMTELRNAKNILNKMNDIFDTANSQVYLRYSRGKITVFISIKEKMGAARSNEEYETEYEDRPQAIG